MCILFLFIDPNPPKDGYRLILALNRDEYYKRPTKTAHEWEEDQTIIGGRDMQSGREGGTWFAIKFYEKGFKLGALLNISGLSQKSNCPGRGAIVADYMKTNLRTKDYLKELKSKSQNYNPFNFVTAEVIEDMYSVHCINSESKITQEWVTGSNCENKVPIEIGVGNSALHKPFKKVEAGLQTFKELTRTIADRDNLIEQLLHMLQSKKRYWPDDVLSACNPTWGEQLSSVFIENIDAKYGTRTHTIVLLDHNWRLDFIDVSLNSDNIGDSNKWIKKHITKNINGKF